MKHNTSWFNRLARPGLCVAAASLFGVVSASAATFTVNSTADVVDANLADGVCETATPGECTLRAAVQQANFDAGADTIVVPAGTYTITIPNTGGHDTEGDLDLLDAVTITGAGSGTTIIDGNGAVINDRVFDVFKDVTATLSGLTIQNGDSGGQDGGGIRNEEGTLTLTSVRFSANSARQGGGLFSKKAVATLDGVVSTGNTAIDGGGLAVVDGSASVVDSTFSSNTVTREGGGVFNDGGATTLTRVTVSGNSADDDGGGVLSRAGGGTLDMINSTVSGNSALGRGGGIHQEGDRTSLLNVTIANNDSPDGGGLRRQAGTFELQNTIVALSTSSGNCSGTVTDNGNNLADDTSCVDAISGTPIPDTLNGLDPTLADNGGPTQTHALLTGSSAIDAGSSQPPCPYLDQRLYSRNDGACDIGAYEFGAVLPVTLSSFLATPGGGVTRFEWSTATETGNIGFNLYALTGGEWRRVNGELIRSRVIDSVEPQDYEYQAEVEGERFFIEDVDVRGRTQLHGPFAPHETYGGGNPPAETIDWQPIRRERRELARQRRVERGAVDGLREGSSPARSFALPRRRPAPARKPRSMQLLVDETGLYRVTYEALRNAGLDLAGVSTEALALTNRGEAVPIYVRSAGRQRFDVPRRGRRGRSGWPFGPGSFIEFYGESLDTLYTKINVYELRVDPRRALRAESESGSRYRSGPPPQSYLESLVVERNLQYNLTAPSEDPWFDTRLLAYSTPVTAAVDFEVDQLVSGEASLSVELLGLSGWPEQPDHHVEVRLNGSYVAEDWFDDRTAHVLQADLPPRILDEGTNTLELSLPADTGARWDMVALDRIRVTYPRRFVAREGRLDFAAAGELFRVEGLSSPAVVVYRIDGDRVTRLGGVRSEPSGGGWAVSFAGMGRHARYLVSAVDALRAPRLEPPSGRAATITRGLADYLIISHPDFIPGLDPLIAERERQGLRVKVVDVEDVYQRFSHGILDPEAIRRYIAFAARRLGTEQVLLVGGDSYDYHDYLGKGAVSFLPSLYAATDDIIRFAPVDPLYADVDRDGAPDLAIGRFPVRTSEQLDWLIGKTLDYADKSYGRTGVFAADALDAKSGESFAAASEALIGQLAGEWDIERAYLDELGASGARETLLGAINQGTALTSFYGHSGPSVWSFSGLFNTGHAMDLENFRMPTVVAQWGCWNSYYVSPSFNLLAHTLLLTGDQGAAAVLGAATLTSSASDWELARRFMPRVAQPGTTLGEALRDAKQDLATAHPEMVDVLLGWMLLGDPALVIEPR